jgi:hypothetical protein
LDPSVLQAAEQDHEAAANGHPHVRAKGLDRDNSSKSLVYTSPELGSESPNVQRTTEGGADAGGANAQRPQRSRGNPNRGSRGNRSRRKR